MSARKVKPAQYKRAGVQLTKAGKLGWRLRPVDPKSRRQLDQVFWGSEQEAAVALADLEKGLAAKVGPTLARSGSVTVGEWAPVFLASYAWVIKPTAKHPGKQRPFSTWATMRANLNAYVIPALGPRTRLASLTYDDCEAAVGNMRLQNGGVPADATRRTAVEKMQALLGGAVRVGLISANPAAGLPSSWGEGRSKLVIPSTADVDALSAAFVTLEQQTMADAVLAMAYGGFRWEELVALEPADIDFENAVVRVAKVITESGGRRQARDVTKTAAGEREVLLLDQAREPFERLVALAEKRGSQYVVSGTRGNSLSYSHWRRWLKKAKEESNVTYTAHDLRHVAISMLIAAGADIETVRIQAGHSTTEVTQTVYRHLWKRDRTADAAALSEMVRRLAE